MMIYTKKNIFYLLLILAFSCQLTFAKKTNHIDLDFDGHLQFGFAYTDNSFWSKYPESNVWNQEIELDAQTDLTWEFKLRPYLKAKLEIEVNKNKPIFKIEDMWLRFKFDSHRIKLGFQDKHLGAEQNTSFQSKFWISQSLVYRYLKDYQIFKEAPGIDYNYKGKKTNSHISITVQESKTMFTNASIDFNLSKEKSIGFSDVFAINNNAEYQEMLFYNISNINVKSQQQRWHQITDFYYGFENNKGLANYHDLNTKANTEYSFIGVTHKNNIIFPRKSLLLNRVDLWLSESWLIPKLKETKSSQLEFLGGINFYFSESHNFRWFNEIGLSIKSLEDNYQDEATWYYKGFKINSSIQVIW